MIEPIKELIKKFRIDSDKAVILEIIARMTPLIDKYVNLIHCMDKNDAKQELLLALIESIHKINHYEEEEKCVGYLASYVRYKYIHICKEHLLKNTSEETMDIHQIDFHKVNNDYENCIFHIDISSAMHKLGQNKTKIIKYVYWGYTDQEIATLLQVSRQYINRIKKEVFTSYLLP